MSNYALTKSVFAVSYSQPVNVYKSSGTIEYTSLTKSVFAVSYSQPVNVYKSSDTRVYLTLISC